MDNASLFLFSRKEWFYLTWVVVLVLLSMIHYVRWRRKALAEFGGEENVRSLVVSTHGKLRAVKRVLTILVLCFLVIAAAGPMWGKKAVIVKSRGKDIIFIVDISSSMTAEDVHPSRLERAKLELSNLLVKLSGNRLGLIIFSGDSYVLCPLTLDSGACSLLLDCIEPGNMPRPGTSLSGAIEKAIASFETGDNEYKAIVLISDGEDLEGEVEDAVSKAREYGIRIFSLGIGTGEGAPIPERDERGDLVGYKKDRRGATVITKLNRDLLEDIADRTGGVFFLLGADGATADRLATEIDKMDEKVLAEEEVKSFKERFQVPLFIAFLLLAAEASIGDRRKNS